MVNTNYISARRKALELNQSEAARRAGFGSPHHWSRIEKGRHLNPRADTLMAVARVLSCKVDDLLLPPPPA